MVVSSFYRDKMETATTGFDSSDDRLFATLKFPVAPKTIGDVSTIQFLWMMLCDQVHHRGQCSICLRIASGKLPSIYANS